MVFIRGEHCQLCRKEIQPGEYVRNVVVNRELKAEHCNCLRPDDFYSMLADAGRDLRAAAPHQEGRE